MIETDKKQIKKSKVKWLIILLLFALLLGIFGYIVQTSEIKSDPQLLKPIFTIDKNSDLIKSLKEIELAQVVASFNNPLLIPKGTEVPDFTMDQDRPTRHFLGVCEQEAIAILKNGSYKKDLFDAENILRFNNAFIKTNDPKYLKFLLKAFVEKKDLSLEEMVQFVEMLKVQRNSVPNSDFNLYASSIAKILKTLELNKNTLDPIVCVQLLLLANSMPLESIMQKTLLQVKPVLANAFQNKNETRKDGLFLSSEESTQFSEKLIDLAWQYYMAKKAMPDWLSSLIEKEACRLAYRLEPDGCLPQWKSNAMRTNKRESIFKAALVFDRDDLRYVAFGGFYTANAYAPEQKSFDFNEIGILIFRTSWNNNHHKIYRARGNKLYEPEESIQITINQTTNQVSLSVGAVTQIIFETSNPIKSVKELIPFFEINITPFKIDYDYKIMIHKIDLKIQQVSPFYQMIDNQITPTAQTDYYLNEYQIIKNAFNIQMSFGENNLVKEINFLCKRR